MKTIFKTLPIDQIFPYAQNNKMHPESQIEKLAEVIREVGFLKPLILDDQYEILAGHGAFAGGVRAGLLEIPCIIHTGLSVAQKKAYRIADNKLAEESLWDYENLSLEVSELISLDFDVSLLAFDEAAINKLLQGADELEVEKTISVTSHKRNVAPKKKKGTVTVKGDEFKFLGLSIKCNDKDSAAICDWIIGRLESNYNDVAIHAKSGKFFNDLKNVRKK